MKKIPYALCLLAAYIVMTFLGAKLTMEGGTVIQLSNLLIFVGPMVLAVLMIIGLKKPLPELASIVCLLLGIAWVCISCVRVGQFVDLISEGQMGSPESLPILAALPGIFAGIINALLYLAVTGKLQEDEVSGGYSALAGLGFLVTLIAAFVLKDYTGPMGFLAIIPALLHITVIKNLPAAFLRPETCKKLAVKHIITLVVLTAAFAMKDKLFTMLMSL